MKTHNLLLIIACICFLASCGQEQKNTPLPQNEIADDWVEFSYDSNRIYTMYSKVSVDSGAYIASIRIQFQGQELKKNPRYSMCKLTWAFDSTLTKVQECGITYYDDKGSSFSQGTGTMNSYNWTYVTPGTIGDWAANTAKILYDDAHDIIKPVDNPIQLDWGSGNWHQYKTTDTVECYFNESVTHSSDSTYNAWIFVSNRRRLLDYEGRVVYGVIYNVDVKKGCAMMKENCRYFVDKFNDVYAQYKDINQDWTECPKLQPVIIQFVKQKKL